MFDYITLHYINKNETMERDETYNERDSLQREILEGIMEGNCGRGRPRQKLLDWMMSDGYSKLKEGAQRREYGPIGGLDLPHSKICVVIVTANLLVQPNSHSY